MSDSSTTIAAPPSRTRWWIGSAVMMAILSALVAGFCDLPARRPILFGLGFSLGFIPLIILLLPKAQTAVTGIPKKTISRIILATALLCAFCYLPQTASDDVHRYIWEGQIQWQGHNPYAIAPQDPALDSVVSEHRALLNHPEWAAIYGPVAEMAFASLVKVSSSTTVFKLWVISGYLLSILLLLQVLAQLRLPAVHAIWYAWNPLVVWAFAGEGHLDAWMVAAVLGMIWALGAKRFLTASLCIAIAAGIKVTALLFLPCLFFVAPKRWTAVALGGLILLHVPYLSAGNEIFGSVLRFGKDMQFNASMFAMSRWIVGPTVAKIIALFVMAESAVWCWKKEFPVETTALFLATMFILWSPTVHFWYLTWLLPWSCMRRPGLGLTLSWGMLFALATPVDQLETGAWLEPTWQAWLVYAPVACYFISLPLQGKKRTVKAQKNNVELQMGTM